MTILEENACRAIAHNLPKIAKELEKANKLWALEIVVCAPDSKDKVNEIMEDK